MPEFLTAFILLAAGESSRMGRPKQMLEFNGMPLLRHAAEVALASGCQPVVVVLGAGAEQVRPLLDGLPVLVTINDRWSEGMASSIQAGLSTLLAEPDGVILGLADQPFVNAKFLRQLPALHQITGKPIVAAQYSGTFGVPAFFARPAFAWLRELKGGQGCKGIISGHPDDRILMDCPEASIDVDTPEDYQQLLHSLHTVG